MLVLGRELQKVAERLLAHQRGQPRAGLIQLAHQREKLKAEPKG